MTTTNGTDGILEQAESHSKKTTDRAYAITGNKDLTAEAQQRQLDELWIEAEVKMEQLRHQHSESSAAAERNAERALVRPPSTDPARVAHYRSALDRANAALEDGRLGAVLEEAELIGDEDQALAAFTVGLRSGVTSVVQAFLADRPSRHAAYQKYADASRQRHDPARSLGNTMSMVMPHKPRPGDKPMFG